MQVPSLAAAFETLVSLPELLYSLRKDARRCYTGWCRMTRFIQIYQGSGEEQLAGPTLIEIP
jgi:hypothetical protein